MRRIVIFCSLFISITSFGQGVLHVVPIGSSAEDVEQEGDRIDVNDLELDIGMDEGEESMAGLFFRDVHLVQGADIQSATMALTIQSELTDTIRLQIALEENPFPDKYNDSADIREGRMFVPQTIEWIIPPTTKNVRRISPELKTLIQPLVNLENWEASSNLNFNLRINETVEETERKEVQIYSYDQNDPSKRPQLRIYVNRNFINGAKTPLALSEQISFYPNPADDVLWVSSKSLKQSEMSIYDVTGKEVLEFTLEGKGQKQLDVSKLNAGLYLIRAKESVDVSKVLIR